MSDTPIDDLFASRPDLAPDGAPDAPDGAPDAAAGPEGEVSREEAEAMARELAEARERLLDTEVSTVLVNHALGIYELAAIHLTAPEPDLVETRLAIDAFGVLVEGLAGRLGDQETMLTDALAQIKMAYVQRVQAVKETEASDPSH